jgi:glycosyltransferase involved in cell wall biosynthesis
MPEPSAPKVSAIVSTYNAELFIRGALADLVGQSLFHQGQLEIIVIDSGSQQGEAAIVREFQRGSPAIRYLRTERETIYAAWNRGVELARGEYLTNANADDRHRSDALEVLAATLDAERELGVVYANSLITTVPNQTFAENTAERVLRWPDYSLRQLLMHSYFGPHPMWRRCLHAEVGSFNPSYVVAGDYEFFLRAAWRRGARHLDEVLGLYFEGGLETKQYPRCRAETQRLLALYRARIPLEDIYPALRNAPDSSSARAVALWDLARCITLGPNPDPDITTRLRTEAIGSLLRAAPRSWGRLALLRLLFILRNRSALVDSGPWHPILDQLAPISYDIVRPANPVEGSSRECFPRRPPI